MGEVRDVEAEGRPGVPAGVMFVMVMRTVRGAGEVVAMLWHYEATVEKFDRSKSRMIAEGYSAEWLSDTLAAECSAK